MHRVRVGLIGLCSVFLLVALATALLRMAGSEAVQNSAVETIATGNAVDDVPTEPLAQLGVVPGNVPPPATTTPAQTPPPPVRR